jgi:hypothetical protein
MAAPAVNSKPHLLYNRSLPKKQKCLFSAWGRLCMATTALARGINGGLNARRGISPPGMLPSLKIITKTFQFAAMAAPIAATGPALRRTNRQTSLNQNHNSIFTEFPCPFLTLYCICGCPEHDLKKILIAI